MTPSTFTLIGRSSSSFTRVARIFAAELGVACAFQVVYDLKSLDAQDYGGNPALKVPSLRSADTTWFGALNICRALERASERRLRIVWPEAFEAPLLANVMELVLQAMSTEVGLIMSQSPDAASDAPPRLKMTRSLGNVLAWLEINLPEAQRLLPRERDLSYLEVALFCLLAHLDFRKVMATAPYPGLIAFRDAFAARASCSETEYRFD